MIFWKYSHWYAVALRASIFILLVCSAPLISLAQFNPEINYQAKLTDSAGVAVTSGDYDIVFRLYTASSTGTAIWTESRTGADQVNVQNGLFSVMLGDVNPLSGVDFNQTLYLGVTVGADSEMTPRKVLGTVPAAFIAEVANNANQVGGVASSSFLRSDQADTMVASTTSSLLTINQQGAGNILDLLDNGTSVFTVADGGNVGVGISNPNQRLTVHGNINIVDSNSGYMIDNNRVLYASSTNQSTLVGAGAGSSLLSGGLRNTAVGFEALNVVTDASNNTAIGYQALAANTTGSGNVAAGVSALSANTTGFNNAANGYLALTANTTGTYNVAMGFRALTANTIGDSNTAIGRDALLQNTIGNNNVALGRDSLAANTTGSENIGVGFRALNSNTTARRNVAVGVSALNNNMTGDNNVALGYLVMRQNVSGVNNIALGTNALYENITGNGNIAMGDQAGRFLSNGTSFASTTDNSIFIGGATRAVTDNDQNSIVIGYQAQGLGSNTVVIGNDSISATALKGNVGIGTTTPSSKLTIAGDVSLTGDLKIGATTAIDSSQRFFASDGALAIGGLSYSFTNDSNTGFYNSAPNEMRFVTNTTDRMTIMANGNVGIGTTTPSVDGGSARLTLQSAGNNGALQLYSPDVTTRSIFNVYGPASTDTESGKAFGFVAIGDANASGMFYTDGKYGIGNGSGSRDTFISRHSTSMLKISSDGSSGIADLFVTGDIGIGTAAPSSRLTVAGDAYITGALRDSTNSAGTTGYILQTTGSGTEWVATSSLGVGASFSTSAELADLISDETGSGPLVFANSATMNSLTLSGAGQQFLNIDFDTNNNQTGMDGYIRFRNDGSAIAVASMGYSESIDALVLSHSSTLSPYHFVVNNQGNVGIGIATPSSRLAVAGDIDIVNPASGLSLNGVRMFYASTTNRSVLIGNEAGSNLNDGSFRNIAIGELALSVATSSDNNVAIGAEALRYSTSGRFNTAIGSLTLENNTTGQYNMALGGQALRSVTTGSNNVAIGFASLANVDSDFNIAIGRQAGGGLLTGTENIFIGSFTGLSATSTSNNTYIGRDAARFNTNTTGQNVTLGHRAGRGDAGGADYTGSVIIGYLAGNNMTTASNNILLGWRTGDSLTSGTNNIVIGYDVEAPSNTASNQLNIGNLIFGTGVDGTGTTLSSGNVGIGVTNPTNKLEVDGTILSRNMTVFNDDAGVAPFVAISGAGDAFNYSGFGLGNTNNARQWSWLYRSGNTVAAETDQLFLQYYDGDVGYYDPLAISSTTVTMNTAYISSLSPNRLVFTNAAGTALADSANFTYNNNGTFEHSFAFGNAINRISGTSNSTGQALMELVAGNGASEKIGNVSVSLTEMRVGTNSTNGSIPLNLRTNSQNRLTIDVEGRVGIGTTTPQSKLDVWGDFRVGTGTVSTLFANAANGRVGIGTISPNFNLSLSGNSNQTIGMNRSTAGAGNDLTIEAGGAQSGVDSVGGDLILSSGRAYDSNDNGDLSSIDFKTTGRLLDDGEIELIGSSADVLPTTKMTILGNGRVGIGTETPTSMLSVRATGAGDVLDLIATTSASLLRVTSLGDIGIGTTTPSAKLTVAGDSITTGRILAGATVDLDGVVNLTGAAGMTTDGIIAIEDTFSDFSFDRVSAIGSIMDINPDANYAAGATDGYSSVVQTRAGNGFNLGEITGSTISVGHLGSGTITDTIGQFVEVLNLGGGTLTNTYGLYVGDVTDGSQTNTAYSIYAQDSNAWNYFAGNTGIGTTTPGSRLAVVNTTTSLSNTALGQFSLQVNPATNGSSLYSGIMNTLKTPSGTTSNIGSLEGVTNIVTHAGTGAVANGIIGTANKVTVSGNSTNGSVLGSSNSLQINDGTHTSVYGHSNNAQFNGGTVTNYIGVSDSVGVFGGDIENYYGGYFITPFIISGAIENTYGVYIQDVASAATTNGWNLYVEGASSQNYIAGNLGIGDTNPTTKLSVSGGGVKFSTLSAAASGNITVCINNTTKVLFQGASATTCTPSSIEYKNTVASTSNMMAIVRELDTVTFFFNEGDEEQQIGFIAEDVSKVDSRLVQFDANGKPGALKLDNFIGLLTASVRETDMSLTELFTTGVPSATSTFAHIFEQNEDTIWSRMVTLVSGFVDGVLTIAGVRTSEICLTDGGGETCIDRSALENLINGSNSTQPTAPEPSYVPPKAPNEPIVDDTAASTSEDIPPDITATTTEESTATSTTEETSVNRTTETSDDANSTEAAPPDIQTIGASEIASSTDTTDSE